MKNIDQLDKIINNRKIILISPFSSKNTDGGGWASRKITKNFKFSNEYIRPSSKIKKVIFSITSWILTPFLHPLFCRYTPTTAWKDLNSNSILVLNHSQTFALTCFSKNTIAICHDLQIHRSSSKWVLWTEKITLKRAQYIIALSERDVNIIINNYHIPHHKVYSAFDRLTDELENYTIEPRTPLLSAAFVGSLDRKENRDAIVWVINNILNETPNLIINIIGKCHDNVKISHPRIIYVDYINDLTLHLKKYDLCIAPMLSSAGVKIKTLEYLKAKKIVLGTTAAFSGFSHPPNFYVSDHPCDWISIINNPKAFIFEKN